MLVVVTAAHAFYCHHSPSTYQEPAHVGVVPTHSLFSLSPNYACIVPKVLAKTI